MKSIDLKNIAETTGFVAVVASLIFVGMQLRQTQEIAMAEGYAEIFSTRIDVVNNVKEHVDIWRRGTAGEELNEAEAAVFAALLNQLNESAVQAFYYKIEVASPEDAYMDAQDFAGFLYLNPGARAVWNQREDNLAIIRTPLRGASTGEITWTDTVRGYLMELDRVKPQVVEKSFIDW